MSMFSNINELSVLVSAILAVAVASIWYSPLLFGSLWLKVTENTPLHSDISTKTLVYMSVKGVCAQAVSFAVITYIIALGLESGVSLPSISLALLLFLGAQLVNLSVWEGRSLTYIFIHLGYNAIVLFGGVAIIAYWPW